MAKSVVTPERFAKGMTFDEYVKYTGSPENLAREAFGSYFPDGGSASAPRKDNSAVFRDRYARARLSEEQAAAIKWLVTQPDAPAKILVISEDWSSDCRRDVPMLARLAEAGGMELRIFNRDGQKILGTRRPDPAVALDRPSAAHLLDQKCDEARVRRSVEQAAFGPASAHRRKRVRIVSDPVEAGPGLLGRDHAEAVGDRGRPKRRGRSATLASSPPCRPGPSSTCGRPRPSPRS